jgi:hypothetical protein
VVIRMVRLLAVERYRRREAAKGGTGGRPDGSAHEPVCGDSGIDGQPQVAAGASDAEPVAAGRGCARPTVRCPGSGTRGRKGACGRCRVNAGAAARGCEEGEAEAVRRGFKETGAVCHSPATHRPTARRQHLRIEMTLRQFELGCDVEPRITRLVGMMHEGAASGDPRTWSSNRRAAAAPISHIGWRMVVSAG